MLFLPVLAFADSAGNWQCVELLNGFILFRPEFEGNPQLVIGGGSGEHDKRGLAVQVLEHGLQLL